MLSVADNELLCRTGPGTSMGRLMREYWVPALRCSELPEADCAPVRVMLLGEKLVAFRDSSGRVGLVANACPHRGASLYFGRNEENGLRCVYHGWKFDVSGRCVDMPNEPPSSNFKDKVRARAYPCVEKAGFVWTYMGSREEPPPMPHFEVFDYPDERILNTTFAYRCNWVQAMEGNNDFTHAGFLHNGHLSWPDSRARGLSRLQTHNRAPVQKLVDLDAGVMAAAHYPDHPEAAGQDYWKIAEWMFPFYTVVGTGELGQKISVVATVPIDDSQSLQFVATAQIEHANFVFPRREYTGELLAPNTTDWYGRFRWEQNIENDYLLDRELQRSGQSFTGIDGNIIEDVAITESMGPIVDRSSEHLASADAMIIRIRKRLIAAARSLVEDGKAPPGLDDPNAYLVRAGYTMLPEGADWIEGTRELRKVPDTPIVVATAGFERNNL